MKNLFLCLFSAIILAFTGPPQAQAKVIDDTGTYHYFQIFDFPAVEYLEITPVSFESLETQYAGTELFEASFTSSIFSWLVEDPGSRLCNNEFKSFSENSKATNLRFVERIRDKEFNLPYSTNGSYHSRQTIRKL
jgi:hypothetical protein